MEETSETALNAALIRPSGDNTFVEASLAPLARNAFVVAGDLRFAVKTAARRVRFDEVGLASAQIDTEQVVDALLELRAPCLIVDMGWLIDNLRGTLAIDQWAGVAATLSERHGLEVISVYDRGVLIEEQLQAALRAHPQFAAPSGLYPNPFFLPPALHDRSADVQIAHLLAGVVPDYASAQPEDVTNRNAARGAGPQWLGRPRQVQATASETQQWHILCLGPLQVYTGRPDPVDWTAHGGSPKKTRALFAFLLHCGERGARAERIPELLWPREGDEAVKRQRLHYVVSMLRKTLGGSHTVLREGDYYRLNVPEGSWIDMTAFEQLCRRAFALDAARRDDDARRVLEAAEKIYRGDLFEDVPEEALQSDDEDWCLPKRVWVREMALKVQCFMSRTLRENGKTRLAMEHCQKALAIDAASAIAHEETMRVLRAQGRRDALKRQYRQYLAAQKAMGESRDADELSEVVAALLEDFPARDDKNQRKTKARTVL